MKKFGFDYIPQMRLNAGNSFLFAVCDKGDSH